MKRWGVAFAVAAALCSGRAAADAAPPATEAATLNADLERFAASAASDDCALACRALESMRRAAQRICEIDPGDDCAHATDMVRKARERVRTACPTCVTAKTDEAPPGTVSAQPAPPEATEVEVQHKGGGCAGCATSDRSTTSALPWALGLALLVARRRRARRKGTPG